MQGSRFIVYRCCSQFGCRFGNSLSNCNKIRGNWCCTEEETSLPKSLQQADNPLRIDHNSSCTQASRHILAWDSHRAAWYHRGNNLPFNHLQIFAENWLYTPKTEAGCTSTGWFPQITICTWSFYLQPGYVYLPWQNWQWQTEFSKEIWVQPKRKTYGVSKAIS